MSKKDGSNISNIKTSANPTVLMVDAIQHIKKRQEFCFVDPSTKEVVESIWQIGPGKFFLAKGAGKVKRKGAEFLGHYEGFVNGALVFHVSLPSHVPTHSTPTRVIRSASYSDMLSQAYAVRRGLKLNGEPVSP